jgi:hypothetical protein
LWKPWPYPEHHEIRQQIRWHALQPWRHGWYIKILELHTAPTPNAICPSTATHDAVHDYLMMITWQT